MTLAVPTVLALVQLTVVAVVLALTLAQLGAIGGLEARPPVLTEAFTHA